MAMKKEWNDPTSKNEYFDICVTATTQMVKTVEGIRTTGKVEQGKRTEVNSTDLMNGDVQNILIEKELEEKTK